MTDHIVSTPVRDAGGSSPDHQFSFYEIIGCRPFQEDALAWQVYTDEAMQSLSPAELGFRLWTCYNQLNKEALLQDAMFFMGTTACTTVYDGRGNLVTASVGDAVSFAAFYNKNDEPVGVIRLNNVLHSPKDKNEVARIEALGGRVVVAPDYPNSPPVARVNDLSISRAIGDAFGDPWVSADARIDLHSLRDIQASLNLDDENVDHVKIIVTCDGFTERAKAQTRQAHEEYLLAKLKYHASWLDKDKPGLARFLAERALRDGSGDNISVSVQNIDIHSQDERLILQGVYDGHGGAEVSHHVAKRIGDLFYEQCQLSPEAYASQALSVTRSAAFRADHEASLQQSTIPYGTATSTSSLCVPADNMAHQFNIAVLQTSETPTVPVALVPATAKDRSLGLKLIQAIQIATTRYRAYHSLSRDQKALHSEINRGQGDGYLSFFRHTSSGMAKSLYWKRQFNAQNKPDIEIDEAAVVNLLCELLSDDSTSFSKHSYGSYVLDAVRKILLDEGIVVQENERKETISTLVQSIKEECVGEFNFN